MMMKRERNWGFFALFLILCPHPVFSTLCYVECEDLKNEPYRQKGYLMDVVFDVIRARSPNDRLSALERISLQRPNATSEK